MSQVENFAPNSDTSTFGSVPVVSNANKLVDVVDVKFHFKSTKDPETGIESRRATVEIPVPFLSYEGIAEIFNRNSAPELALLKEAVSDIIQARARSLISDNENVTAENFPYEQLTWEAIANLPKAERRGGGISKEDWQEFYKSYVAVMPAITGKAVEQITQVAKILLGKFQAIRTNKPIISAIQLQLGLYLQSPEASENVECVEFLMNKATKLLEVSEETMLKNLGF